MTSFPVPCQCGELFHADDASVGRRIHCRRCGREVVVRKPQATFDQGRGRVPRSRRRRREAPLDRVRRFIDRAAVEPRPRRRSHRVRRGRLARAVAVAAWAYAAGACLVALLVWMLGDAWWPATVLLFAGRWVYLLPLAVLVPAALAVGRPRPLVPLLLGALVVIGPVMGFRTGWRRLLPAPAGTHLRVVTLNVDGGELVALRIPFLLRDWSADVVALQECGPALALVLRGVAGWHERDDGELCLLSRHPIRDAKAMDRSTLERVKQEGAGIGGAGYVVRYTIDTPAGPVGLTNLHLETPRKGLEGLADDPAGFGPSRLRQNTILRDIESDLARRWASQGVAPTIVVGDFNMPVESRIFRRRWGGLDDAFSRAGFGLGMTKYNGWIRARIDHVLTGPGAHADRAIVESGDVGSDHRPLIVDLTLERRSL